MIPNRIEITQSIKDIRFKLKWLRGYGQGLSVQQRLNKPISDTLAVVVDEIENSLRELVEVYAEI